MMNMICATKALTTDILKNIVFYYARNHHHIVRIGVVGSFARKTNTASSDIDLLIEVHSSGDFTDIINTIGPEIQHVLDYQYNRRLDIVNYATALHRAQTKPQNYYDYYQEGYQQMIREVLWLYERQNNFC